MTEKRLRILVVDDEPQIRKLLKVSLGAHGYEFDEATTGADGVVRAATFKPDLIIIDLGLPDMDGKDVVKAIRDWSQTPIIVLTVRDQEQEKIDALDAGADDYVTKPFSMGELMARMRVSLRRAASSETEPVLSCGDLVIDLVGRRVSVGGREIKLTPTEYELIKVLAQHRGRVLTHKQLLKAVWGSTYVEDTHYIRVYIGQLRRKIEENPAQPRYIITESGVGYRLMCHN
ncbi:response regulator [Sporolituus thermophilus]|uniref:Transcriptional regulatory protein KdpE n=1 Tax=Sporolituus thermophilus DSM 23256 TaxID=1123285 RepID=A0A1G7IM11_9FIRM|nr:response regulator [Sporolituus thermophilus]SDF13683.1 two-component system, OmpR family, KDP operon response regulator KdpE [Sporolituus thermophilus DSM 23256]